MSTRKYVQGMAENSIHVQEESREGPSQRMSLFPFSLSHNNHQLSQLSQGNH